jgi:hypothetical protein
MNETPESTLLFHKHLHRGIIATDKILMRLMLVYAILDAA